MNEIQNIDTLTTEILILKQQTAQNIIEIGKRLIAVKENLPHGDFGNYLKEKVEFSQQTASNFMRAAKEFSNYQAISNFSPTKIYALLDLPSEAREEFIKSNPVKEMTTRELQQAIKEKKELEDKLKEVEVLAESLTSDNKKLLESNKKVKIQERTAREKAEEALKLEREKNKEELTNKEVEIQNLKLFVKDIKKKLEEAKESGESEEIDSLQATLQENEASLLDANNKIKELEQQLKEKPIDVITAEPVIVEKIPEAVEKELQELREKASQVSNNNEPIVKFSIYFAELVKGFKDILESLTEIEDVEAREKRKGAIRKLIDKMGEQL